MAASKRELAGRVEIGTSKYLDTQERDAIGVAATAGRELLELGSDDPTVVRLAVQASAIESHESGIVINSHDCGMYRVCLTNKMLRNLAKQGKISPLVAEEAVVKLTCTIGGCTTDCNCHSGHVVAKPTEAGLRAAGVYAECSRSADGTASVKRRW